jgi:argininosuccinate lyase
MTRLWDKGAPLDQRVLRFTAGEDHALDNRLVAYDVEASIAHAGMLHEVGLLDAAAFQAIRNGLTEIGAAHARGEWAVTLDLEDGQTALETLLTHRIGDAGERLHVGRSRNDQVLVALRLYLRDAVESLAEDARRVAAALESLAVEQGHIVIPGYTHMQQAMPSSVALWARGFAAEILDDVDALRHAHRRILKNPLGSAAGYGTPLLMSSRTLTTDEAATMGLVRALPPEGFLAAVQAMAAQLVRESSPRSIGVIKRQVYDGLLQSLDEAWRRADIEMLASFGSEDFREGVAHYLEKRAPAFTGR